MSNEGTDCALERRLLEIVYKPLSLHGEMSPYAYIPLSLYYPPHPLPLSHTMTHTLTCRVDLIDPVAQILAQGVEVWVRRTSTPRPFLMAYTNRKVDLDVSETLERTGMIEGGITQVGVCVCVCVREGVLGGLV